MRLGVEDICTILAIGVALHRQSVVSVVIAFSSASD